MTFANLVFKMVKDFRGILFSDNFGAGFISGGHVANQW